MKGLKESGKWQYFLEGREVTEEAYKEAFPDRPMAKSGRCSLRGWSRPIQSDALAVHPSDIAAVMERNRARDLHVEYNPEDGRPILTSREERRKLMKIEKMHDRNGGYGDDHNTPKEPEAPPDIHPEL